MPSIIQQLEDLCRGKSSAEVGLYLPPRLFSTSKNRKLPFVQHKIGGTFDFILIIRLPDELDGATVLQFQRFHMQNPINKIIVEFIYRPNTGQSNWREHNRNRGTETPACVASVLPKVSEFFQNSPRYRSIW
jgi:hypothetical protein